MTSAVDTNILIDLLSDSAARRAESQRVLDAAASAGPLVISEPVYAELAPHFDDAAGVDAFIRRLTIRRDNSAHETLHLAGVAWRAYSRRRPRVRVCPRCGEPQSDRCEACGEEVRVRQHVLADFLIGAHAAVQADRLITRDRGYYATYFPDLELG